MFETLDERDRALGARLMIRPTSRFWRWAPFVQRISQTGSYGVGWVLAFGVVALVAGGWLAALCAATCVLATLVLNTGIKQLVRRPRPTTPAVHAPRSWSFPSAHTSMAVVGAATMSTLVPELTVLWWAWAGILAWSRIWLGAHWPGDVFAGAVLGAAVAYGVAVPLVNAFAT